MTPHARRRTSLLTALATGGALLAGCSTTPPGADAATSASVASNSTSTAADATTSGSPGASSATSRSGGIALPKGVVDPAAGLVANADAAKEGAPTLEVYEDFQCPICVQAHQLLGKTINELAAAGKIKLVFHPMVFLDEKLGNDSSKTVTNAAACAADAGAYLRYHDVAMSHQPSEGKGYTDAQVQQFAADAGLSGDQLATWKRCEAANTYAGYVRASEETALASGVNGTPTFKLNGKELDLNGISPQVLLREVEQAGK